MIGFIHSGFLVNEDFYKLLGKNAELYAEKSKLPLILKIIFKLKL